jgi:plastocyanin
MRARHHCVPRILGLVFLTFLLVAALAACGDDDGKNTRAGNGASSASGSQSAGKAPVELPGVVNNHGTKKLTGGSIAVEQDDFYFSPTFIEAKPGTEVTVELTNEGKADHTFTIDSLNVDQTVPGGRKGSVTFTLPKKAGTVQFHCRFHEASGMQGAFVVR